MFEVRDSPSLAQRYKPNLCGILQVLQHSTRRDHSVIMRSRFASFRGNKSIDIEATVFTVYSIQYLVCHQSM